MSRFRSLTRRLVVVVTTGVVLLTLAACAGDDNGPGAATKRFLADVGKRDISAAAARSDNPSVAGADLEAAWKGLQATKMHGTVGQVKTAGDTATAAVKYEWTLPRGRIWNYDATIQLSKSGSQWQVRWTSTDIHPKLGASQTMALRTIDSPRAAVNESDGTGVLVPGTVVRVQLDAAEAAKAGSVIDAVNSLVAVLARFDDKLSAQAITEEATSITGKYTVMTLSKNDFDQVSDQLAAVPGESSAEQADMVPIDPTFAPDLVTQVKKQVSGELDGKAGWRVVSVNSFGADVDVLAEVQPDPAPSVTVSLSRRMQSAAQAAVNRREDFQTMMVVIQPSTGNILAIAQNPLADKSGNIATTGMFPPGSTFKMITSAAAITTGLATPQTMVGCPGEVTIGDRTVPNYNHFALGTVSMQTAFARSCNTSFAKLASEMGPTDLTNAAMSMGIGPEYKVPGVSIQSGSVPVAPDLIQRTEDGFGQGKVLTSPFGLAMAAATIASGKTITPTLILGRQTTVTGQRPGPSQKVISGLRPMMRSVVEGGTADRIRDQGEIFGKTGEAEVPAGSHAWFAGYRGDIAFATLVALGGSSDNAVAVTKDFFTAIGPN